MKDTPTTPRKALTVDVAFALLPEWLLGADVSAQAIRLYAVLATYADKAGQSFPSRRTLAERLHVKSKDTVDRALKELGPADGLWLVSEVSQALTSPRASVTLVRKRHVLKEPPAQNKGGKKSSRDKDAGSPDYVPTEDGQSGGTAAATPGREAMVKYALAQSGKPYIWGASGPSSFDCSGLVQAATRAAGKTLGKPSASQWSTCVAAGKTISVAQALRIRGALLFRIGGTYNHVAISLGNGSTVEAKGSAYGCGVFGNAAGGGWTGAALWL